MNPSLKNKEALAKQLIELGIEELAPLLNVKLNDSFEKFLTCNPAMLEMKEWLRKLAPSNLSILIIGESGTGKELIARAIHELSHVKGRFVGINCAGIPNELLESEFFGSKKGAYTGSIIDRIGLLHEAHEGTLFLDEIGDMPLLLQCKLLRAIQDKCYRRLGDTKEYPITCRILSATNKSIGDLGIRADLFYRLAGSMIELTPLRKRVEDIELICTTNSIEPSFTIYPNYSWLSYPWPGNVRELLNKIAEYKLLNNLQ